MNKPNLKATIEAKVNDGQAAEAFFGLKKEPDAKWLKTIEPGVAAAQAVVDELFDLEEFAKLDDATTETEPLDVVTDHEVLTKQIAELEKRVRVPAGSSASQIVAAALAGQWARKAIMLVPLAVPVNPWVHFAHMAQLRKQPWLGYHQETDTLIQLARNLCADQFLRSEAEWSWWVDGDIAPPCGYAELFYDPKKFCIPEGRMPRQFAGMLAIDRLVSHKKSIVGGVYQQRRASGKMCIQPEIAPDGPDDKDLVARLRAQGPLDRLVEVKWCATGCLLVHRSVYEDIKAKRPDLAPKAEGQPWNFFGHNIGAESEDVAFSLLAAEAGHQPHLDLGLWCAHVGNQAFIP